MAKTRRDIKQRLSQVDAVTELLDARIPLSSRNPDLDEITAGKPRIVLLNKCDMADSRITNEWVRYFNSCGQSALAVDCRSGKSLNRYNELVRQVLSEKIKSNKEKGMPGKPLRIMVLGIPNTGKSSFINRMAKRSKAKVADTPGVTKQSMWFSIGGGIELLDTPGVLWPKFDDPQVGDKLLFIGSVKDEVTDTQTMAMRLLDVLCAGYSELVCSRYGLTDEETKLEKTEVLQIIGKKRGMLMRGGVVDLERTGAMILDEYRSGKLGKISFERPNNNI